MWDGRVGQRMIRDTMSLIATPRWIEIHTSSEANLYTSKIQPTRVKLCCHCAGDFDSPVDLNSSLKVPDGPRTAPCIQDVP